jgi:hypothetical protein
MTTDSNPKLQVTPTAIPEALILERKVIGDNRGRFTESFIANDFEKATGINAWLFRLILFFGSGFWIYILMWAFIKEEQ